MSLFFLLYTQGLSRFHQSPSTEVDVLVFCWFVHYYICSFVIGVKIAISHHHKSVRNTMISNCLLPFFTTTPRKEFIAHLLILDYIHLTTTNPILICYKIATCLYVLQVIRKKKKEGREEVWFIAKVQWHIKQ